MEAEAETAARATVTRAKRIMKVRRGKFNEGVQQSAFCVRRRKLKGKWNWGSGFIGFWGTHGLGFQGLFLHFTQKGMPQRTELPIHFGVGDIMHVMSVRVEGLLHAHVPLN